MFEYIAAGALAGFVVWQVVLDRFRAKQIRLYARNAGFIYIGGALPRSFPIAKTSVRGATIRNAVAGDKDKTEVILFDCRIGPGKGRYTQTLVAVRGVSKGFGGTQFDPNLTTERVDDWVLIYRYKKLLPPEEIEALLSSI